MAGSLKKISENVSENVDIRPDRLCELDLLLVRMGLLKPADRILLEMRYKHGVSFGKIAALSGIGPGTAAYRIRKLVGRLLSDDYITILRAKDKFSRRELLISYDYFLLGLGCRAISAKRRISYAVVCRGVARMKGWLKKIAEGSG